jgi:hypothetical protein
MCNTVNPRHGIQRYKDTKIQRYRYSPLDHTCGRGNNHIWRRESLEQGKFNLVLNMGNGAGMERDEVLR